MDWKAERAPIPTNRDNWRVKDGSRCGLFHGTEKQAKLIAAAPDMLEALKFALSNLSGHVRPSIATLNDLQFHIRNAIEKATE